MRKQHKSHVLVRIGKVLTCILMLGFIALTVWTSIDNGIYKNTWNNTFKKEQEQTVELNQTTEVVNNLNLEA